MNSVSDLVGYGKKRVLVLWGRRWVQRPLTAGPDDVGVALSIRLVACPQTQRAPGSFTTQPVSALHGRVEC